MLRARILRGLPCARRERHGAGAAAAAVSLRGRHGRGRAGADLRSDHARRRRARALRAPRRAFPRTCRRRQPGRGVRSGTRVRFRLDAMHRPDSRRHHRSRRNERRMAQRTGPVGVLLSGTRSAVLVDRSRHQSVSEFLQKLPQAFAQGRSRFGRGADPGRHSRDEWSIDAARELEIHGVDSESRRLVEVGPDAAKSAANSRDCQRELPVSARC